MFSYWAKPEHTLDLCRILNDDVAKLCAERPNRFVGLGTLPMQAPDLAIEELRRCVEELGMPGVQIGSHIEDWDLDALKGMHKQLNRAMKTEQDWMFSVMREQARLAS